MNEIELNLTTEQKFFLMDYNSDLVLVDKITIFPDVITNKIVLLEGQQFCVDWDKNDVDKCNRVVVQTSFGIDNVSTLD